MSDHTPWEPDPRKMGNWRAMFEQPRRDDPPRGPQAEAFDDAALDGAPNLDPAAYRPWTLQRGRSRPAMMLELRRYEPRSGLWQGWIMAYPTLHAVDYMGDRMIALDFGQRQFVIEGNGLSALVNQLQQGVVVAVQEYCAALWPSPIDGAVIAAIRRAGTNGAA